jgi:hypothetical protein
VLARPWSRRPAGVAIEGEQSMSAPKGLMDWLFGSETDRELREELADYSDDIQQYLERMQDVVAELGTIEHGDVERIEQARHTVNDMFDNIAALAKLELEAIAQHRTYSEEDKASRKGIQDRIMGMLGNDAAADRDRLDREMSELAVECSDLLNMADQLERRGDNAYSPAWIEAAQGLRSGADEVKAALDGAAEELANLAYANEDQRAA